MSESPRGNASTQTDLQNIPFPFHLLWRLDTLLLNLGLTLILSAYYFDPAPIYRHHSPHLERNPPATAPSRDASPYLWLVWFFVVLLHVLISLAWKIVWRVGIGAVTWGVSDSGNSDERS